MHKIKFVLIPVLCLLFMIDSHVALGKNLVYQVQIHKDNPYEGIVFVDTSGLQTFELLPARSLMQNSKTKLIIKCDEKKGLLFDAPITLQCKQISWKIKFEAFDAASEDIAQQENLFIAQPQALWILTEWDNLPRFANHEQVQVCMSDDMLSRCQDLPTMRQPPLIFPFAHKKTTYKLKKLDIHLFSNINEQYERDILKKYDAIITYLASIFPNNLDKGQWDLIWLPIEKSLGSMGGAAGHNSFMANYPIYNGQWTEESEKWLLKISAHEAVHVLTRLNAPLWAEESLAEYYAYKALNTLGISSITPLQNFLNNKDTLPHSKNSLYYANKNLAEPNKDMSFYPLVYMKGAAFWYEVDMELQGKGKNLDDYIKHLDGLTFVDGKLPISFEAMLQKNISAPVWKKIKQKYLLD